MGAKLIKKFWKIKWVYLEWVIPQHPNVNNTFYITTDTSVIVLGAELYQLSKDDQHQVIAFASQTIIGSKL